MSAPADRTSPQQLLVAAAEAVLGELAWEGEPGVTESSALARYTGTSGEWLVICDTFPDQPLLLVYSLVPDPVPSERTAAVIEYLSLANNGLPRANLEFDVDSRLVRCRTSLDVEDVDVEGLASGGFLTGLVRRVVLANVATLDLFLPGLRGVIDGSLSPEQADAGIDDAL